MRKRCYMFSIVLPCICVLLVSCSSDHRSEIPAGIFPQALPVWTFLKAAEKQDVELAKSCSSMGMKRQVQDKGGWIQVLQENSREIGSQVNVPISIERGEFVYDEEYRTVTFSFLGKPIVSYQVVQEDGIWKIDIP